MAATSDRHVLRFGAFEVNLDAGELRKHGLKVKLKGQSFSVLVCLLEKPGELVTRDELRHRIWPENTHVDFDNSLNTMIRHVREALGDSARNPRFIDTVPRQGYRFVAPVAAEEQKTRRRPQGPYPYWIPVGLIMVVAVGLLIWLFDAGPPASRAPGIPQLAPLTAYVGVEENPSFSPDGSRVAFQWNGAEPGGFDIYVKKVNREEPQRLTSHRADDLRPAWSPMGGQIAFLRKLPGNRAAIMVMSEPGRQERQVAVIPSTHSRLAWTPDGKWIAYSVLMPGYVQRPPEQSGILAVSVESGQIRPITIPDSLFLGDRDPAFSPDGRSLAFIRLASLSSGELYVVDLDDHLRTGGEPRRLTFDNANARTPAWMPDGKEIIYSCTRGGYRSLWRLRLGRDPQPVALGGEQANHPAVSPQGDRIAYARTNDTSGLWKIQLEGPDGRPSPPQRLTRSTRRERNVAYSPDGRRIAFESNRSGASAIWVAAADGSEQRQLTFLGGTVTGTPRWSPDGQSLAFDSRVTGPGEIFAIDASGGEPRRLTNNPADDVVPDWSRDGKWVYFASNRTGRFQVWKLPAAGGEAVQVTQDGGFHAKESHDGEVLYYAKQTEHTPLYRVPVGGGQETRVLGPLDHWENFSVGRRKIYFMTASDDRGAVIRAYDLVSGSFEIITTIDASSPGGLSVSPDERTLVFAKQEEVQSDLVLMSLE